MVSPEAELAKEFFSIDDVTGFYVAQTFLFLNMLGKEVELRTSLSRKRDSGRRVT